jgi:hypothetical protein
MGEDNLPNFENVTSEQIRKLAKKLQDTPGQVVVREDMTVREKDKGE